MISLCHACLVQEVARLVHEARPDILVHGHSHKYSLERREGVLHINPGSAGPARFRLPRTAALLELHPKVRVPCAPCHWASWVCCIIVRGKLSGPTCRIWLLNPASNA